MSVFLFKIDQQQAERSFLLRVGMTCRQKSSPFCIDYVHGEQEELLPQTPRFSIGKANFELSANSLKDSHVYITVPMHSCLNHRHILSRIVSYQF